MERNEFEKNISQKLDGFKLIPSEENWAKIEKRIHQNRRRRLVLWLSSTATGLFILLATITIVNINGDKENKKFTNTTTDKKINLEASTNSNTNNKKFDIQQEEYNDIEENNSTTLKDEQKKGNANLKAAITFNYRSTNNEKNTDVILSVKQEKTNDLAILDSTIAKVKYNNDFSKQDTTSGQMDRSPQKDSVIELAETNSSMSVVKHVDDVKMDTSAKQRKTTKVKTPWKMYIHTGIGMSVIGDYFVKPVDVNQRVFASFVPGVTGNLSSSAVLLNEAEHSSRTSFQIGLHWRKERKKSIISFGFNYLNAGSKVIAGARVDTAISSIQLRDANKAFDGYINNASANSNQTYVNQLHIIGLQVGYGAMLFKKINWQTNAGISLVYAEKYLHYISSRNIYVQDKSLIRPINFFISTGPEFVIGKKQQFLLNPSLAFFVQPVQKNSVNGSRKLMNLSLNFSMPIRK